MCEDAIKMWEHAMKMWEHAMKWRLHGFTDAELRRWDSENKE